MTNRNLNWNNRPLMLKPAGKDYLWGGTRLNDDFSKHMDLSPLAETWECSTHPEGLSLISGGSFDGRTLKSVLAEHPEYGGSIPLPDGELPVLVKLIDARENLSVQVHPDDAYARLHEQGQRGKDEMWYVLDASCGARLIYGFQRDIDRAAAERSLAAGTFLNYLQYVPIQKGDVFFIPAGQVHALGAGALVAEIQETSNLTYRLYDYGRTDKNGRPRPLHIDKALDVANLHGSARPRQPMRVLRYRRGCASELLCRCKSFQVERLLINTERQRDMADFLIPEHAFQILLCVDGCGILFPDRGEALPFFRGDCMFLPADCVPVRLHGKAELLKIGC